MRSKLVAPVVFSALALFCVPSHAQKAATLWLTTPDRSALLAKQSPSLPFTNSAAKGQIIDVDETQRKIRSMDGFGFALTGGSAHAPGPYGCRPEIRAAILRELFATDGNHIGITYLRVGSGSSDLNDHVFSYDDLPEGETEIVAMKHFDLGPDRADVIPVLKEILAINPKIKILGSPWSAPCWMKTNGKRQKAVSYKPEYYACLCHLLRQINVQAMKAEGIRIDAVTLQNEPLTGKQYAQYADGGYRTGRLLAHHIGAGLPRGRPSGHQGHPVRPQLRCSRLRHLLSSTTRKPQSSPMARASICTAARSRRCRRCTAAHPTRTSTSPSRW